MRYWYLQAPNSYLVATRIFWLLSANYRKWIKLARKSKAELILLRNNHVLPSNIPLSITQKRQGVRSVLYIDSQQAIQFKTIFCSLNWNNLRTVAISVPIQSGLTGCSEIKLQQDFLFFSRDYNLDKKSNYYRDLELI